MKILRNIACVQINLDDNQTDFYFPDNVLFHDKVIDSVALYAAPAGVTVNSPFDGRQLVDHSLLDHFYLDIARGNKDILHQAVNGLTVDLCSNSSLYVGQTVDFTLSKVNWVDNGNNSISGKCLLAYITFHGIEVQDWVEPTKSVTVSITTTAERIKIADYLDEWIQRKQQYFRGVAAHYAQGNEFYLSLRETSGKVFEYVPAQYMKDNDGNIPVNNHPIWFDYDLDFKDSWIVNAMGGSITFDLTFYY